MERLYLLRSRILKFEDFTEPDKRGGVYLRREGLKVFLWQWEQWLQKEVTHPHAGVRVSYRRCFELQVVEYVEWLRGEREIYRPMVWGK